jgi:clan AA aspartic protease (TIGR02281 family)
MGKVSLPHWVLISFLVLGSLLYLCFYHTQATAKQENTKVLMAAIEPSSMRNGTFKASPVEIASLEVPKRSYTKGSGITVPFRPDNRALMLQATLDSQQDVTFILDTGATYTTISKDLAEKLGYDLTNVPHVNITTANGQVSLPKITLKSLTFNGYTVHNVEATVMTMPKNVPFGGLLGLSFVKRHKITIDYEAEHLVIVPQGI